MHKGKIAQDEPVLVSSVESANIVNIQMFRETDALKSSDIDFMLLDKVLLVVFEKRSAFRRIELSYELKI